jgi:hypothetical protein
MTFPLRFRNIVATVLMTGAMGCSADTTGSRTPSLTIKGGVASSAGAHVTRMSRTGMAGQATRPGELFGDPAAIMVGMYALYISQASDCSNPTLVEDYGTQDVVKDFLQHPTLFTGSPLAATYSCVGVKMSSVLSARPKTTFGDCDSTQTYVESIYNADNTGPSDSSSYFRDIDLHVITPLGTNANPVAEPVLILFTSDTAAAIARGFSRHQTLYLAAPLVVPGTQTFIWGGSGTMMSDSTSATCNLNPGTPTFE